MSLYSRKNRRSRRARVAEAAILHALAQQEIAAMAVLENVTAALDQIELDQTTAQAIGTPNETKGIVR
jgi:hypothetical protein